MKKCRSIKILLWLVAIMAGITLWFSYHMVFRQDIRPYTANAKAVITQGTLSIHWLGTASLLLDDGKNRILIDPYFSRLSSGKLFFSRITPDESRIKQVLQKYHITGLDAVLVSHSHFDHVFDVPYIAKATGAKVLGSESTANIARGQEVDASQITIIKPEQPIDIGDFSITFIPGTHGGHMIPHASVNKPLAVPVFAYEFAMGEVYSILVEHPEGSFLHHASAGYIPGSLEKYHADSVFLGIALDSNTKEYVQHVVKAIGAKQVYPIHWDDFSLPLDTPLRALPFGVDIEQFTQVMQKDYPDITVTFLTP